MNDNLVVYFGAISDKLSKQLKDQKFKFNKDNVNHFEEDIEAMNRLRIRGYLTDSVADKVRAKLYKKIEKHVMKENNLIHVK